MKQNKFLCCLMVAFAVFQTNSSKAQTEGDAFFAMPQVHDIYMTFPQANYWDSLVAYMPLEQYLKADISIDGVSYANVGIKFKGNSSYTNPSTKKPFKIDMNEFTSGHDVDGLKKFNLNNGFKDPSFMREKVALDFCNEHHIAAPRCAYARVYLNGVYWGLYMFVEEANKTFLDDDDRFGNKQGNLFKGDPSGDLKWINSTPSSYYTKYELHTNETTNDWTDLVDLINKINNSGTYFHDSIETVLQTTKFIKQWAALNVFVNLDSYIGSGHNYFIYHDTLYDKFEWIAWDVNESFGNFNMGMTTTQLKNLSMFWVTTPATNRPLVNKMLADPTYRQELINTICNWVGYDFSNAGLDSKIDSLANAIRADVYADTKKFYTNTQFEDNINMDISVGGGPGGGNIMGIKSFINERRTALIAELATNGCINIGITENTESPNASIYPNPATTYLNIDFNVLGKTNTYRIMNMLGQEVLNGESSSPSEKIDLSSLSGGMYIVQINNTQSNRIQIIR